MYQRLLFVLSVLLISCISFGQNVMTPTDGYYQYKSTDPAGSPTNPVPVANLIQKWVYDSTQNSDPNRFTGNGYPTLTQSAYKCYRWNKTSFRLRFPNNYNPALKYPCIVFLHGAGEAASVTKNPGYINHENRDQLYWGAKDFEAHVNQGLWNGFLLFPQIFTDGAEWDVNTITPINDILDTLQKYNGLDPDRVISMGLSAGGIGALKYATLYPQRIATTIPSCPEQIQGIRDAADINSLLQIPIWMSAGGIDKGPDPANIFLYRDAFTAQGGDLYLSYYPTLPHQVWDTQWARTDTKDSLILVSYWNAAHKAQPLVYGQNTQYCTGQPVSTQLGLTAGFAAYEWQYSSNGTSFSTIPGATSNTYTATQLGQYRARFMRTASSGWSDWSPKPIVISSKTCAVDTAFAEHFDETPNTFYSVFGAGGTTSPYTYNNVNAQNGLFVNATETFSQDASGRQGGRFLLHNTSTTYIGRNVKNTQDSTITVVYHAGDQVWRLNNPITVTPNTDYTFSFYLGNQTTNSNFNPNTPVARISATINDGLLSPTGVQAVQGGNTSWKKYSFKWNSGFNTTAQPALLDSTIDGNGNDFVIDEISLIKYTAPAMPASFKNVTLWAKANTIMGNDGSPVGLWTNNDVNGDNLEQTQIGRKPLLKSNPADNINFNPVVNFQNATARYVQALNGFSGSAKHEAVHAYIVANFSNVNQTNRKIIYEPQSSVGGATGMEASLGGNGIIKWYAGSSTLNNIFTPANTLEANKPVLLSFSKDSLNNTGSGNKQDIRKNGVVVASSSNVSAFIGLNSPFQIGAAQDGGFFDGNVAEVIYILDSTVNTSAENQIESYLAIKYGTSLGNITTPRNYTASDGTTIVWPGSTKYQNDVFGIGTDSASGLVQRISNSVNSGSGDGTGQSAKGNLVLSTNANLLDKRFVMIGNDAGTLTQHVILPGEANPVAVGSTRVGRNWKVSNVNAAGPVSLSFDTTGLMNQAGGADATKYSLMISNSGDDTYTGPVTFFAASSGSGKKIMFSGVTLSNGAVFTVITNNANLALPAVWLGFTAEAINGNGVLNWKTGDEVNVDHYTVEHSLTGLSFAGVGTVAANNAAGVNNYNFTHTGLAAGMHYYRIRRADKDGRIEYSDTKSIKIPATSDVQVRPNPVVGSTLILAVSVPQNTKTNIQVMGVDGKVIAQQNVNLITGTSFVNLNIADVPPGIYLVRVQLIDQLITRKFVKAHN